MQETKVKKANGFGDPAFREIVRLAGKQPYLSKEEEQKLLIEAQRTKSPALRQRIGTIYLRSVVQLASYYYKRNVGAEITSFIQAGSEGLMEAIDKFDPSTGNRFITCAWWWIRIKIQHDVALHNSVVTPKRGGDTHDLVQKRTVSLSYLAEDPDLNAHKVEEILSEDVDPVRSSPEKAAYDAEIRQEMRDLFKVCPSALDRAILSQRILELDPRDKVPLQRMGETHGCSRETVRKDEIRLLKKLRRRVTARHEDLVAA